MKVLVVEDDLKVAKLLQRALTEEGYVIDCCANGDDALAQGRSGLYDLIVLDLMIPGIDGFEVCRLLRHLGSMVPILMLTARAEVEERVLGLSIGADSYLVKPFTLGCLKIDRAERKVRVDGKVLEL